MRWHLELGIHLELGTWNLELLSSNFRHHSTDRLRSSHRTPALWFPSDAAGASRRNRTVGLVPVELRLKVRRTRRSPHKVLCGINCTSYHTRRSACRVPCDDRHRPALL